MSLDRTALITQIITKSELKSDELQKLKTKLVPMSDEQLQSELSKLISNSNVKNVGFKNFVEQNSEQKQSVKNVWGKGFCNASSDDPFGLIRTAPQSGGETAKLTKLERQQAREFAGEYLSNAIQNAVDIHNKYNDDSGVLDHLWNGIKNTANHFDVSSDGKAITTVQENADKLNAEYASVQKIKEATLKPSAFDFTFERERQVPYHAENIVDFKKKSDEYIEITAYNDKYKQLTEGLNNVKQIVREEENYRNALKYSKGVGANPPKVSSHEKFGDVLLEFCNGDKELVSKYMSEITAQKDSKESIQKNYTEILTQLQQKCKTAYAEQLKGKTFEQYTAEYQNAYKKAFGGENPKEMTESWVMGQKQGAGFVKMGVVIASTVLLGGSNLVAATGAKLGQTIGAQAAAHVIKFGMTTTGVGTGVLADYTNALTSKTGLNEEKNTEILVNAKQMVPYAFFGAYVSGPLGEKLTLALRGSESAVIPKILDKAFSTGSKASGFTAEIALDTAFEMAISNNDLMAVIQGNATGEANARVMNKFMTMIAGGRANAASKNIIKNAGLEGATLRQDVDVTTGKKNFSITMPDGKMISAESPEVIIAGLIAKSVDVETAKQETVKPEENKSDVLQQKPVAGKAEVKVYNSFLGGKKGCEITSPEFNGCHGIAIVSDGEVFFTHFPPIMPERMANSLNDGLNKMHDSPDAKVIYVTPVDSKGNIPKEFSEYTDKIKEKFANLEVEHLTYPERSKGLTYQFELKTNDSGEVAVSLDAISRKTGEKVPPEIVQKPRILEGGIEDNKLTEPDENIVSGLNARSEKLNAGEVADLTPKQFELENDFSWELSPNPLIKDQLHRSNNELHLKNYISISDDFKIANTKAELEYQIRSLRLLDKTTIKQIANSKIVQDDIQQASVLFLLAMSAKNKWHGYNVNGLLLVLSDLKNLNIKLVDNPGAVRLINSLSGVSNGMYNMTFRDIIDVAQKNGANFDDAAKLIEIDNAQGSNIDASTIETIFRNNKDNIGDLLDAYEVFQNTYKKEPLPSITLKQFCDIHDNKSADGSNSIDYNSLKKFFKEVEENGLEDFFKPTWYSNSMNRTMANHIHNLDGLMESLVAINNHLIKYPDSISSIGFKRTVDSMYLDERINSFDFGKLDEVEKEMKGFAEDIIIKRLKTTDGESKFDSKSTDFILDFCKKYPDYKRIITPIIKASDSSENRLMGLQAAEKLIVAGSNVVTINPKVEFAYEGNGKFNSEISAQIDKLAELLKGANPDAKKPEQVLKKLMESCSVKCEKGYVVNPSKINMAVDLLSAVKDGTNNLKDGFSIAEVIDYLGTPDSRLYNHIKNDSSTSGQVVRELIFAMGDVGFRPKASVSVEVYSRLVKIFEISEKINTIQSQDIPRNIIKLIKGSEEVLENFLKRDSILSLNVLNKNPKVLKQMLTLSDEEYAQISKSKEDRIKENNIESDYYPKRYHIETEELVSTRLPYVAEDAYPYTRTTPPKPGEVRIEKSNHGSKVFPFEKLQTKPTVNQNNGLPTDVELMMNLNAENKLNLLVPNSGGMKPVQGDGTIHPQRVQDLNVPQQAGMAIAYGKKVRWTKPKIARDMVQNFYDGHGKTMEGVGFDVVKTGDEYTVKITGEGIYNHYFLEKVGASSKDADPDSAGNFGEGAKVMSAVLLNNLDTEDVKFACQDWSLNFTRSSDNLSEALMMKTLTKNEAPIKGNYIEFKTKDAELVQEILKAKDYYYHPNNKDFQNLDFENDYIAFKYLGENRKGNLYLVQRYDFEKPGQNEKALNGFNLIFKKKLDDEKLTALNNDNSFVLNAKGRDRGTIYEGNLRGLVSRYSASLSDSELTKVISSLENIWKYDVQNKKPRGTSVEVEILKGFIDTASKRNLKIDFDESKYLSVDVRIEDVVVEMAKLQGHPLAIKELNKVGMPMVHLDREKGTLSEPHTSEESRSIRILDEGMGILYDNLGYEETGLFTKEEVHSPKFILEDAESHYSAKAIHGKPGHWINRAKMRLGYDFGSDLAVWIHETLHKNGDDISVEFTRALVDAQKSILTTLTYNPQAASKMTILAGLYTNKQFIDYDVNFNAPLYKFQIAEQVEENTLPYPEFKPNNAKPLENPDTKIYQFKPLEAKPANSSELKLPTTESLLHSLHKGNPVDFSIPVKGTLTPKKVGNTSIKPGDRAKLGKEIGTNILVKYGTKIDWTSEKVARDIMQNFYDGNGWTLEGIDVSVVKDGDDYKVKISGKGIYPYEYLENLGTGAKEIDPRNAGGYGEGTRIVAVNLLRDSNFTNSVEYASGEWKCTFKKGKNYMGEQEMTQTLNENAQKIDGNYIELKTKDLDFVKEILEAKDYFYHPYNEDYHNLLFENNLFAFKPEDGHAYYGNQRFATQDGIKKKNANLTMIFKQTGDAPELSKSNLPYNMEPDRERTGFSGNDIEMLAGRYASTMTDEQLTGSLASLEKLWTSSDEDKLKYNNYKNDPAVNFVLGLINEAKNRNIKFDVSDKKLVYAYKEGNLPEYMSDYLRKIDYKYAIESSGYIGAKKPRRTYFEEKLPKTLTPNELEAKKMQLIKEAVGLFNQSKTDLYLYDKSKTYSTNVYKYTDEGYSLGKPLFIDREYLKNSELLDIVVESLSEIKRQGNDDRSAQYSYDLTSLIGQEIRNLTRMPEIPVQLGVLNDIYKNLK